MVRKRRAQGALNQTALQQLDPEFQKLVEIEIRRILKVSAIARAEHEEITACAWLGFLEAQGRFDPRRGVLFSTFAKQRVRGAILDGLADLSPLGRKSIRAISRSLRSQDIQDFDQQSLESESKTKLKSESIPKSDELNITQGQAKHTHLLQPQKDSLEADREGDEKCNDHAEAFAPSFLESYRSLYFQAMHFWTESLSQALNGDPAEPYENQTDSKQASQYLSLAFEGLSLEQQQLIIAIYDLRRVGDNATKYTERMGLHRSTVSRRHAAAIDYLRTEVQKLSRKSH